MNLKNDDINDGDNANFPESERLSSADDNMDCNGMEYHDEGHGVSNNVGFTQQSQQSTIRSYNFCDGNFPTASLPKLVMNKFVVRDIILQMIPVRRGSAIANIGVVASWAHGY